MKQLLLLTLLIVATSAVHALVDVTYDFNSNNNDAFTNNVRAVAYNCLDSSCNTVDSFSGSFPDGAQSASGRIRVRYPSALSTPFGYAVYFVASGFAPSEGRATWNSLGDDRIFTAGFNVNLNKIPECRSLVHNVTVLNVQTPFVPVVIETKASLDALTESAFALTQNEVGFVPPELRAEFYSTDVRVTLLVRDSSGSVVDRQAVDFKGQDAIFAGENKQVRFEFTPKTEGTFTATVTTEVIDNQCSSQQPQSSSKQFVVKDDLPRNECFTLLNGLKVDVKDNGESFSQERTFMLESLDRSARSLTFVEQDTASRVQVALDANFVGNLVVAGTAHKVTLESNDFVVVEGTRSAQEVRIPAGGSVTLFGATEVSKRVDFTFNKISTHVSDNPFSQAVVTPVPTKIEAWLQDGNGQVVGSHNLTITANSDTVTALPLFLTLFTKSPGVHQLTVTGRADSALCNGLNNTQERLTTEFFVRDPETFAVTFQILDASTGRQVESADISAAGKTAKSNSQGTAVVAGLRPGSYGFSITHPAFVAQSGSVNVVDHDATVLIALQPLSQGTPGVPPPVPPQQPDLAKVAEDDEEEDSVTFRLKIESIRFPEQANLDDGNVIPIHIAVQNDGDRKLEDVKFSATILELGARKRAGPFDISVGEHESRTLAMELPEDVESGWYMVRLELGNDEVRRVVHRQIHVILGSEY